MAKILEVVSAFTGLDGEDGRVIVNFSKFPATEAWDKMDKVVEAFKADGWIVIDQRYEPMEQED